VLREKREEKCFNNTERTRNKQERKKNLFFDWWIGDLMFLV